MLGTADILPGAAEDFFVLFAFFAFLPTNIPARTARFVPALFHTANGAFFAAAENGNSMANNRTARPEYGN